MKRRKYFEPEIIKTTLTDKPVTMQCFHKSDLSANLLKRTKRKSLSMSKIDSSALNFIKSSIASQISMLNLRRKIKKLKSKDKLSESHLEDVVSSLDKISEQVKSIVVRKKARSFSVHRNEKLSKKSIAKEEYKELNTDNSESLSIITKLKNELKQKTDLINNFESELFKMKADLQKIDSYRSHLHDYIMQLRGSIRVGCRIKPTKGANSVFRLPSFREAENVTTVEILAKDGTAYPFHFDYVFPEESSQQEVII